LLGASVKSETVDIETVAEEIEKLREVKSLFSTRRLIAAGVVLIACIAVLLVLVLRPPPPPEKAEWESLCSTYQAWVDDLRQRSNEQQTGDRWSRDAELSEILRKIEIASYPDKVMRDEAKLYIREIVDHPEYAEQRKTRDALTAVEQISSFFDPNSADAWPFLAEMTAAANKFKNLGWQPSAIHLSTLVEKAKPEPNKPIVDNINTIFEIGRKGVLKNIDLSLQNVAEYEKVIKSSGDPILIKLDYAYVTGQIADATEVNELSNRLDKLMDLSRMIAEFIERDWQSNIDHETLSTDYGNDSAENPTVLTFTERLDVIKGYYYLRPDPREAIFSLVSNIERYIKEALISNPKEANACVENLDALRPRIKEVQEIRPIAKNEQQIHQTINQYKPQLDELLGRADRARELPRDYVQRIRKDVTWTAKAHKLNKTWIVLRDRLLNEYPLGVIEQNLESYAELRHKMDETFSNLTVLDRELQTHLPQQLDAEAGEKSWEQSLIHIYDLERLDRINRIVEKIPLANGVTDIDDSAFKDFRTAQFAQFGQWRTDLADIAAAFGIIEYALELCYLLNDDLLQGDQNIRSIWKKCKDTSILEDSRVRDAVAELIARIGRLEQIEQSSQPPELVQVALETGIQSEAAYAAWIRLGRLPDSSWPVQYGDLIQDRTIRDSLKREFEAIGLKNEARGNYLSGKLAETSLKHETEFITRNQLEDAVLRRMVEYAAEMDCVDALSDCERIESLAKDVVDFLAGEDWQTANIAMQLFSAESDVHNADTPVTAETFSKWLTEVRDYKKLKDDPRTDSQYSWDEKISKIDKEINNELGHRPEGDYLTRLQSLKSDFEGAMQRIKEMRELPLIEKHKEKITRCSYYWQELRGIERKLKPEYCSRLDIDNGRLIFATTQLHPNFEPVDTDKKNSVQLPTAWEQIREAVKNKQREWLGFFYTIDGNDAPNLGWPRYIRSTKDPTVILVFIPVGPGNSEPFYMAANEITNRQYRLFLEKGGATRGNPKLPGWSIFTDQTNNKLIQCTVMNKPPTAIQWDDSGSTFQVAEAQAQLPVTWVTYYGAQAYSQWFGGQLPSASQHEYACSAGTGNIQPWGGNISEIESYAHTRGSVWQKAADDWNRKKDSKVPPLPVEPIGAIEDYRDQENRILDPNAIVLASAIHNSVWPVAGAPKANAWGLHDMIGNVWEWCQNNGDDAQPVICGGSCVAPPKHILLEAESDYKVDFNDRDNDVGFRVIVLAK
jgi:formylglycine-generating enzyme required for sulfatase activity